MLPSQLLRTSSFITSASHSLQVVVLCWLLSLATCWSPERAAPSLRALTSQLLNNTWTAIFELLNEHEPRPAMPTAAQVDDCFSVRERFTASLLSLVMSSVRAIFAHSAPSDAHASVTVPLRMQVEGHAIERVDDRMTITTAADAQLAVSVTLPVARLPPALLVLVVRIRGNYSTEFDYCDTSMRVKDWCCRKRGTQAT
jgi:hypothetical protein